MRRAPYDGRPRLATAGTFPAQSALMTSPRAFLAVCVALAASGVSTASASEDGNVRITVTHEFTRGDRRDALSIGVRPRIESSRATTRGRTVQQLLVMSGGEAAIAVAEDVPYADWFWTWGGNHGLWPEGTWRQGTSWQQVGASLVVQPLVLQDGRIRVRLTPRFSYFLDRRRQTTDVQELATEVVVREGEEIDVGGVPMHDREFLERFLIGVDRSGSTQQMVIRLKASAE
jgi:hypothetical protein